MALCAVPGCDREAETRGWCQAHYVRWHSTGDVHADRPVRGYERDKRCSVEGCETRAVARGYCPMHYQRWRAHGDPSVFKSRRRNSGITAEEWFWRSVDKDGPAPKYAPELGPCWLWIAGKSQNGYGAFSLDGKTLTAHRVAYVFEHGEIPAGTEIDHLCRVRACVRPSHLEAVTHKVNMLRSPTASPAVLARSDTCRNGHERNEVNTFVDSHGHRRCRPCRRDRHARWLAKQ